MALNSLYYADVPLSNYSLTLAHLKLKALILISFLGATR